MRITNTRNNRLLADRCRLAASAVTRLVGLLNKSSLDAGEGLLIRPCSSVHTMFMRFPIDVVFLDPEGKVLRVYTPLKPWRSSRIVRGAKQTLELPAGAVAASDTRVGDRLVIDA